MSASASRSVDPTSRHLSLESGATQRSEAAVLSKVLNLAEAAAFVRCSRAHLSNIANGKVRGIPYLPTVRIGRRVLFRRESLELWLEQVEAATAVRAPR
jgi:hypothetical protein